MTEQPEDLGPVFLTVDEMFTELETALEPEEVPAVYAHAGVAAASGGAGPDEEGPTDALD